MACELRASVGPNKPNIAEDVGTVQAYLQLVGSPHGGTPGLAIDGQFGSGTEAALKAFQAKQALVGVDGIADPGDVTVKRLQFLWRTTAGLSFAELRNVMIARLRHEDPADEVASESLGADAVGIIAETHSELRRIYDHPNNGTWELEGDILAAYKSSLEDAGNLGYPLSNVRGAGGGALVAYFEKGRIFQAPGQLAVPQLL